MKDQLVEWENGRVEIFDRAAGIVDYKDLEMGCQNP